MTRSHQANPRLHAAADVIADAAVQTLTTLRQWHQLSRSRRELAELDEYQLKDIGLSRSQAMFESDKTFLQH